jgi:hypothetical protein
MAQRLKRWESPRREGRNDKGKGGAARRRQLKKQTQMLRKRLKDSKDSKGGKLVFPPFFDLYLSPEKAHPA